MGNKRTNAKSQSPQFKPFPHLPKELRLKVWELAAQVPRIVEICQSSEETISERNKSDDDENTSDKTGWDNEETTSDRNDSEESDDEASLNPNPFYSPTAIPSILHTNHESRSAALEHYIPSFAHSKYPATILYNSQVDILYFPAWCFQYNISQFEERVSDDVKDKIKKVAIENLVWYSGWSEGMINNQIQISDFGNLEEFYLIGREPDFTGCGCCHSWDGPERGVVGFEADEEAEERKEGKEGKASSKEEKKEGKKNKRSSFSARVVRDVLAEFENIKKEDEAWQVPEVKLVRLKRNGVII